MSLISFIVHFLKPIAKTIPPPPPVDFKNRKTNRKIRESFKTIVLHLGTVKSNKERKPLGKTYSLVKLKSNLKFL
jgi:hypothetical protein